MLFVPLAVMTSTIHFINFTTFTIPFKSFHIITGTLKLHLGCLFTGDTEIGVSSLILRTSHVTRAGNEWTVSPSGRESINPPAPWKLCRWPSPWRPTCSFTRNAHAHVRFWRCPHMALCVSVYMCNGLHGKWPLLHLMARTVD